MNIEPNMYVRTKEGYICKILKLNEPFEDDGYLDHNDIRSSSIQEKNVIKASHNIIDLIEVGDYVNGKQVIEKWEEPFGAFAGEIFIKLDGEDSVPTIRTIKTIVTKKQFEAIKYEVK